MILSTMVVGTYYWVNINGELHPALYKTLDDDRPVLMFAGEALGRPIGKDKLDVHPRAILGPCKAPFHS